MPFGAGALSREPSPRPSPTAFRLVVVGLIEEGGLDENERPVAASCFVVFFLGSFVSIDEEGCGGAAAGSGRGGNPLAEMGREPL